MWRSRRNPFVLSLALVLLLVAAVASSVAVAGADEPVVVGELPTVPILKEPAAQGAAWTQVRKFRHHSPLVRIVTFKGCERDGLEAFTCTFSGRGSLQPGASACRLTVVVTGLGSDPKSVLHPACRANPSHFLTIKRASAAIESAAEELSHHKVTGTIERVGSVELLATVVWHRASGRCEATFIARLTGPTEELVVTHTAPACR
jgi:hypothetical protein